MEAGLLNRTPTVAPGGPRALALKSDPTLVKLAREGHQAAFSALFDRHHAAILAFSRRLLADEHEAEDVAQHTFIAAYRELQRSDGPILLRPWLFTVARNRCLQLIRDRRERPADELELVSGEGVAAQFERREAVRELYGDVRDLPEDQRVALVLSELEAMSHAEIAVRLGVPKARVKALVFQARSSLLATRSARDASCVDIRAQLDGGGPGALRRAGVRRHLRSCAGCQAYRTTVQRHRRGLAALLPAAPVAGWLAKLGAAAAVIGSGASTATVVAVVAGVPLGSLIGAGGLASRPRPAVAGHRLVAGYPSFAAATAARPAVGAGQALGPSPAAAVLTQPSVTVLRLSGAAAGGRRHGARATAKLEPAPPGKPPAGNASPPTPAARAGGAPTPVFSSGSPSIAAAGVRHGHGPGRSAGRAEGQPSGPGHGFAQGNGGGHGGVSPGPADAAGPAATNLRSPGNGRGAHLASAPSAQQHSTGSASAPRSGPQGAAPPNTVAPATTATATADRRPPTHGDRSGVTAATRHAGRLR